MGKESRPVSDVLEDLLTQGERHSGHFEKLHESLEKRDVSLLKEVLSELKAIRILLTPVKTGILSKVRKLF